ncbi:amino acid transporter ANT1 [Rhodamnia argentea]|uniref:Amino acid transporter ANT1 n=1 Tax=Rhodamnia argentea TaxID=178133 RepID=A0A8B8PAX4_9MYRT|nr:amino acid transporter ANT1 [Rhodamnia argentea]
MEDGGRKGSSSPLLESSSVSPPAAGSASSIQTLGNIIVSIVGTGVLGLPFAFKIAGWLAGSVGVMIAGASTYYCMLILVQCRDQLASQEESADVKTYGDLGSKCMGKAGRYLTEFLVTISQCGGAVAYLVFIGQNLASIFKGHGLTFASFIFLLVPLEIALSWISTLSALAPFSIFADVCNVIAMGFVVKEDIQQALGGQFSFSDRKAFSPNIGGLPFAGGMAVFCFEGFGMTLALEASMKERRTFQKVLGKALTGIILVYVLFGFFGYMAYGDETKDIITLNLPRAWTTVAVQIGLCLGLAFTFPIMLHPINEILEDQLKRTKCYQKLLGDELTCSKRKIGNCAVYVLRSAVVLGLGALASCVPGFGTFVSLVGSTVCALLSFVLPASFHLLLLGPSLRLWQKALDVCILMCGLLFAVYGTYNAVAGV